MQQVGTGADGDGALAYPSSEPSTHNTSDACFYALRALPFVTCVGCIHLGFACITVLPAGVYISAESRYTESRLWRMVVFAYVHYDQESILWIIVLA